MFVVNFYTGSRTPSVHEYMIRRTDAVGATLQKLISVVLFIYILHRRTFILLVILMHTVVDKF